MPIQPNANLYTLGFGNRPENVEVPHLDTRAPASGDIRPVGKRWINQSSNAEYSCTSLTASNGSTTATWTQLGLSAGPLNTLTADSGGALSPSGNNLTLAGTAGQITSSGSGSTITFALASSLTAPGSVTTTTTLTAGTGLTVSAGGAAIVGNSTITGSLTTSTTLTATLGAITATNGNLVLGTAGNKIVIPTGSNASVGTSAAMSGTPGAVTVATTACSATAKIFYSRATTGGTPGNVSITAQDGTGFTLTSTANETSTFNWWIINN